MRLALGAGAVMALALGCATSRYSDPGPIAVESGDVTALLIGCGDEVARGSLYCRYPAGWKPTGAVWVVVPPVDCPAPSCATVTVFTPDASEAITKPVPKGQSYVAVPWASLVGPGPLQASQRGFWPVLVKWSWLDPETGVAMSAAAEGEVRLRVTRSDYTPLAFDPSNMTWTWSAAGKTYGATDKGRMVVKP